MSERVPSDHEVFDHFPDVWIDRDNIAHDIRLDSDRLVLSRHVREQIGRWIGTHTHIGTNRATLTREAADELRHETARAPRILLIFSDALNALHGHVAHQEIGPNAEVC